MLYQHIHLSGALPARPFVWCSTSTYICLVLYQHIHLSGALRARPFVWCVVLAGSRCVVLAGSRCVVLAGSRWVESGEAKEGDTLVWRSIVDTGPSDWGVLTPLGLANILYHMFFGRWVLVFCLTIKFISERKFSAVVMLRGVQSRGDGTPSGLLFSVPVILLFTSTHLFFIFLWLYLI